MAKSSESALPTASMPSSSITPGMASHITTTHRDTRPTLPAAFVNAPPQGSHSLIVPSPSDGVLTIGNQIYSPTAAANTVIKGNRGQSVASSSTANETDVDDFDFRRFLTSPVYENEDEMPAPETDVDNSFYTTCPTPPICEIEDEIFQRNVAATQSLSCDGVMAHLLEPALPLISDKVKDNAADKAKNVPGNIWCGTHSGPQRVRHPVKLMRMRELLEGSVEEGPATRASAAAAAPDHGPIGRR